MSEISALYKSLSGLLGFSKGLDNLSSNVANVNTPGYKGKSVFFRDMVSEDSTLGLDVRGESTLFKQGDLRSTGKPTNMAVTGDGFFVVKKNDEYFYTRAGQFEFDLDGFLVDPSTGGRVQQLSGSQVLSDIRFDKFAVSPPEATTSVSFTGNLAPSTLAGQTFPQSPSTQALRLKLFDSNGNSEEVDVVFTKLHFNAPSGATPGSLGLSSTDPSPVSIPATPDTSFWKVSVRKSPGNTSSQINSLLDSAPISTSNIIAFNASGALSSTFNKVSLSYVFGNSSGQSRAIELNMGDPGSFNSVLADTNNSTSNVQVKSSTGRPIGNVSESGFSVDEKGSMTARFTNGQILNIGRVGLANFSSLQGLKSAGDSYFSVDPSVVVTLGVPLEGSFGKIEGGKLEGSNVELSQEFSEIIILQRGYQASSQVLTATSEMLDELYNSVRGR